MSRPKIALTLKVEIRPAGRNRAAVVARFRKAGAMKDRRKEADWKKEWKEAQ